MQHSQTLQAGQTNSRNPFNISSREPSVNRAETDFAGKISLSRTTRGDSQITTQLGCAGLSSRRANVDGPGSEDRSDKDRGGLPKL